MTASGTAVRPRWDELPEPLRDGLEGRLGGITAVDVQSGGFTPGLAARLRLRSGDRVFVKGIPADHPLAVRYCAEARVLAAPPAAAPAPKLWWSGVIADWIVLAVGDIDGRHADLSPGSTDVPLVVEMVGSNLDGWARRNLARLADTETGWLAAGDGPTLLHGEINRSNILATDQCVVLIDWGQPTCGAAWIDIADLIPHLILAGHTPQAADETVASALAATGVDAGTVTSYAAAFAGYWARSSRLPGPPGVPHLRSYQARAAIAGLAWTAHRTQWP